MKEPKQIVYQYDGNPNSREIEDDRDGEKYVPAQASVLMRNGKLWTVVHVTKQQELTRGAIPVYRVFLTASVQGSSSL
jgi:hypothetical protein